MTSVKNRPILTIEQMRMAEQHCIEKAGLCVEDLMLQAGKAIALASEKHQLDSGRIVIIVGRGYNAGDGFVAARLLRAKQLAVTVIPLLALDDASEDIRKQLYLAQRAGVKIRPIVHTHDSAKLEAWLSRAVLVVDAIFGTGLRRPVEGWLAEAIGMINQSNSPVLAVDIASGLDANTGRVLGTAIKADMTLPIAAYKWGHWLQQGPIYSGLILFPAPIGIASDAIEQTFVTCPSAALHSQLIDDASIKRAFPKRHYQAFKQTFGHVWIFGGSVGYTGAAKLAALGAQAVRTGLVSIACPDDVYSTIASASLEVMVHPQTSAPWQKADTIVAGPGWDKAQQATLLDILDSDKAIVLDAAALRMLAENGDIRDALQHRGALTVLTPHVGEAACLLGISAAKVQEDRLLAGIALVDKYHAWVVLKGAQTLVLSPQKEVWLNPFGSVNLATAGTGDVLAGMIGGLLAGGLNAEVALPAAVALHGMVGEKAGWFRAGQLGALIASEISDFRKV